LIIGVIMTIVAAVAGRALSQSTPGAQNIDGAPGEIRGRVLDSEGKPVAQAWVHIRRPNMDLNGRVIFYYTDRNGDFSIQGLTPAEYMVFVVKEKDRHPDTDIFFYSNSQVPVPHVTVSQTQGTPFVTVQTGPPAAMITGRVVDASSHKPIAGVLVTFRRPENQRMMLVTGPKRRGDYSFLLPSAPLTIQVTAHGYETWTYHRTGSTKQTDLLTLAPGQNMQLIIRMKRLRK